MVRKYTRHNPIQSSTPGKKLPPQFSISLEEAELLLITNHAKECGINRSQLVREYTARQIQVAKFSQSIKSVEFSIKGEGFIFSKLISACGGFIDAHPQNVLSEVPSSNTSSEFAICGTTNDVVCVYELIALVQAASQHISFEINIKGEKNGR